MMRTALGRDTAPSVVQPPAVVQSPEPGSPRVRATTAALNALARIARDQGPVIVVLSHSGCAGVATLCLPRTGIIIGEQDVPIGTVADVPVYWACRHPHALPHGAVLLDLDTGMPDGLSLPAGDGSHFVCWLMSRRP